VDGVADDVGTADVDPDEPPEPDEPALALDPDGGPGS
jgi:hypothetical protein